jgi:hypothetical protein
MKIISNKRRDLLNSRKINESLSANEKHKIATSANTLKFKYLEELEKSIGITFSNKVQDQLSKGRVNYFEALKDSR